MPRIQFTSSELNLIHIGYISRATIREITDLVNRIKRPRVSSSVIQGRINEIKQLGIIPLTTPQIIEAISRHHVSLTQSFMIDTQKRRMMTPLAKDLRQLITQEAFDKRPTTTSLNNLDNLDDLSNVEEFK